ncbi:MAG: 2-amino-4-hydroxy-6-hydroxymethyldihydropteridine diphosphokinase [Neomegalonema sp.]|nr:2-amino-4-hydroxy-6-hydroxymethyldihydropteridine diphosphokinase [Neomegalonema sp.]
MSAAHVTAYIGLGANLGDRLAALQGAVAALRAEHSVAAVVLSPLYETAPVGGPEGQGRYLNAAAKIDTTLKPMALLDVLQSIEAAHHRTREVRWGPRTLDLDILIYGEEVITSDRLILPHPRLQDRRFVLAPLADIAAGVAHPTLCWTIGELLEKLDPSDVGDISRVALEWPRRDDEL